MRKPRNEISAFKRKGYLYKGGWMRSESREIWKIHMTNMV